MKKQKYHISKNRLEKMVDGIFAITKTILVLGIIPPKPEMSTAQSVFTNLISDLIPEIF